MRAVTAIDDPDDPRIAAYRDIRERDLVGREGLFIAEGQVVLRSLVQSRWHRPLSLLIADKRIESLRPLFERLPEETPIYAASQAVLDSIAGFPLHRGILALGRRGEPLSIDDVLGACGPRALVVGLMGIANHDNMGGLFRNAAAFGAEAVILGAGCCDPLYRKAIRVSVGAALTVPFATLESDVDPVSAFESRGFDVVSLTPAGAVKLSELVRPPRVAALFGAEGPGLPAEILARTRSVSIPMSAGFDSLNVATTSGIVLHHLAAQG